MTGTRAMSFQHPPGLWNGHWGSGVPAVASPTAGREEESPRTAPDFLDPFKYPVSGEPLRKICVPTGSVTSGRAYLCNGWNSSTCLAE